MVSLVQIQFPLLDKDAVLKFSIAFFVVYIRRILALGCFDDKILDIKFEKHVDFYCNLVYIIEVDCNKQL